MARLFFALWPEPPARAALAKLAAEVAQVAGGRAEREDRIHLTLAFLGEVPEERVASIAALAAATPMPELRLRFDRVGSFRRARVAWAGMGEPDPALAAFQSELAAALRAAGLELEDRPFQAHVTLARRTERPLPRAAIAPIPWRARRYALVRTERGSGDYADVGVFGLG